MRTSTLFRAKNLDFFFKIYGMSARTRRGIETVRTRGEEGSIFRDFVQTYFMDGP